MFVLRRVLNDVYVCNTIVGNSYSLYLKEEHSKDFNQIIKVRNLGDVSDRIFAFVVGGDGKEYPLYKNSRYYMMASNGSTFERIGGADDYK